MVYKAEDTKLHRQVALKFLSAQTVSAAEKERFLLEAQAAAALNHPNIATIHAIEEYDGQTFIVMEYIQGVELKDLIKTAILSVDDIVYYARQIIEGLQVAHDKGVVHRDIKSTNIMVADKGQAKIMDFGLAKIAGGQSRL